MTVWFIVFWILALIMLVTGIVNLTMGITYKKWKRIAIAIVCLVVARYFYYLPYDIVINRLSNIF